MTPTALKAALEAILDSVETLSTHHETMMPEWPSVSGVIFELASKLKTAPAEPTEYRFFQQHASHVLTGAVQALQLTGYSDDYDEFFNISRLIGCALTALIYQVDTKFVIFEELTND